MMNLKTRNPLAEDEDGDGAQVGAKMSGVDSVIHIRIQQRNGRKTLTTVQGISPDYDLNRIVKTCKKDFACNGCVVTHAEWGEVIQLQGDQRKAIGEFLIKVGLATKDNMKIHGF